MNKEQVMVKEFIECYKNNPVMWHSKHQDYQKRAKKDAVLQELAEIISAFKPNATTDDAKRKINTLRCGYRKEFKRIKEAEMEGLQLESTIWWFPLMDFLRNEMETNYNVNMPIKQEDLKKNRSFVEFEHVSTNRKGNIFEISEATTKVNPALIGNIVRIDNEDTFDNDNFKYVYEEVTLPLPSKDTSSLQKNSSNKFCNEVASKSAKRSTNTLALRKSSQNVNKKARFDNSDEDSYDNFDYLSKIWTNKLSKLSGNQAIYAEKAVNDILFEAEMGRLTRNKKSEINYVWSVDQSSQQANDTVVNDVDIIEQIVYSE